MEESIRGNVTEKQVNYDLLTVIMVCLGGKDKENYDGLLKMLDILLSEETEPADKKRTLQEEFGIEMTKKLEGDVVRMCNLSKGVFEDGWDKAKLEDTKNLMKKLDLSMEKSMEILEIPEAERELYKEALKDEAVLQVE